ncbi:beta-glucosidase [Arthrobacter glacialis]|uniref:beta-glucosidase n=1 Tax=Arthrobacter glacialis TaxID=1664 RepID=UPI001A9E9D90|nr:glycoside hydrolase family 3 C-terminal domain-containing protein [Arthrobacter glacialis]
MLLPPAHPLMASTDSASTTQPAVHGGIAEALLAQLSTAEKLAMLHQHSPGVELLGIAAFQTGTEGAHGVAWLGKATVFPQPVGLAATWDEDLLRRVGEAVGVEVRSKHAADPSISLNVWAPVVNPLRHPLWGRNEEGFSEDPVLTGKLASAFCQGLRGNDPNVWQTTPTLKHFLGYNNEVDRNVSSTQLRARVLHEYELPAYSTPIADGAVGAVMLSYNLVNGMPAHVSDLVAEHLRQWPGGSELTIVTDAGAPTSLYKAEKYFPDAPAAYAAALLAGVDNFTDDGADSAPSISHLEQALERGLISMDDVDASVLRLLRLRAATGEFGAETNPYADGPDGASQSEAHRLLASEAAAKSVVLLANNAPAASTENSTPGPLLPLSAAPGQVAVIGALGTHVLTDWYSGTPEYSLSLAEGLGELYPEVAAVGGHDVVALRSIRTGCYLGSAGDTAALAATSAAAGADQLFELQDWGGGEVTLRARSNGLLLAAGNDGYLYPSASRVGGWIVQETFRLHRGSDGCVRIQHVGTGKWVHVETHTGSALLVAGTIEVADTFTLRMAGNGLEAAAKAAAAASVAVVVVGNDPHLGGRETLDRCTLELAQRDQEMVQVVREANPNTVLVIISSYPYALGELASVPAILWSSHAGQELGHGLAAVISGSAEPYGRLPQTWFAKDSDLPDILDYDIIAAGATYQYSTAEPLYAMGHGLGYAEVEYSELLVADHGGQGIEVTVTVRNTGPRDAQELVQIYVAAPGHRFEFPHRLLAGHSRVQVPAGEQRRVTVRVARERLATFSVTALRMLTEPGEYIFLAGKSAADLPLAARVVLSGAGSPDRQAGDQVRAEHFDAAHGLELVPETHLRGTAVAVLAGHQRAVAQYRNWASAPASVPAGPAGRGMVRVARSDGGHLAFERAGAAGSWVPWVALDIPAGSSGEMSFELPSHRGAATADIRMVISGAVVVAAFRL